MHKRVFKKLFLVLMIISLLLSIFNVGKILAAEPTFKLSNVKIEDKSSGVETYIESYTDNKLVTDTTFHKLDDYVKYKLTIENTSDTKYKLVLVDDNNSNDNLTYEYDYNKDEEILPSNSVDVILTITYKDGIQEINQRTQDQEVKISFIVEDEEGNTYEEEITNNPKTSDNILIYIISAIVSLLVILAIVFRKKISKLFVLLVLIIPMITYAVTPSLIIVLKNQTKLFDKMVVYTNVNGVNETVLVDYNTPYERPENPQKPGYDFDNWYVGNKVYNFDTPLTEDVELTAKFNLITYNITYELDGGNVSGNPTTYNVETETFTLNNPTKDGYTFVGWTGSNGSEPNATVTIEKGSTEDKNYVANFVANDDTPYTVRHKYKRLDGTFDVETEHLEGKTDDVVTPAIRHKYGFVDPSTTQITITADGNAYVEYEYIREQYVLTLENTEDINTTFTSGSYDYETKITLTAKETEHYDFVKWSNDETNNPLVFNITENTTIGPIYQIKQYTVSFDEQGGTSVNDITKDYNSEIGTLPETTKDGYLFDGWYTNATGGEKITSDTKIIGNITYYAHYTKSLALATISPESITLTRGEGTTITVTNVEEEYEFISGNSSIVTVDTNGNVSSLAKGTTTITVRGIRSTIEKTINVTVNPIMYTINYDAQGGTSVQSQEKEENVAIGTLPSTTKDDYVFDGWYTNGTGGTKIDEDTIVAGATTYYAHWLKSVSLANVTPESITIRKKETANITVTNVEEEYTFTSSDEQVATVNSSGVVTGASIGTTTIVIEGVKSHATKEVNVTVNPMICTVTFNSLGGESIASKTIEENNVVGTLPIPEKENTTFTGWYTDTNWTTRIYADTVVTDDVTYYARYIEDNISKVFFIPGSCTFNGHKTLSQVGNITTNSSKGCISTINPSGSNINYSDVKYIDTHIALFSSDNYGKDFELGFTIDDYVADNTVHNQSTMVNSKLENEAENYPGFVVRRKDANNGIEVTEKFGSSTATQRTLTYKPGTQIRVARIGGKMYYSQDGSSWKLLQDINDYPGRFNLTTWFGAFSDESDMTKTGETSNADRYFKGTLSNIYIKMTGMVTHAVTFDAHGGTPSFGSKNVLEGSVVGELPTVEKLGFIFLGWFTEADGGTQINENTVINGTVTFHAHYIESHTVTFNGNGGTPSFATKEVGHGQAVGELPTGTYDGFILDGWFTDNSWTTQVSESTVINNNETFIAKWRLANGVAMIGDEEYGSLEAAVDAVPTNGTKTTIKVLQDITLADKITIPSTKNIELDLQSYTIDISANLMFENNGTLHIKNGTLLSNAPEQIPNTSPVAHGVVVSNKRNATLNITGGFLHSTLTNVIENAGTITMTNGRLEANSNSAAINNNQYGVLNISGGQIIATGTTKGQAIYNDKGTTTISGDVYIENTSQSSSGSGRAAVHNNQGTVTIKGGTIVSKKNSAVKNNATMIIGDNSNPLDITTPSFQGDIYGLEHVSGKTTTVYDGIFKGKTDSINDIGSVIHNDNVDFNTSNTETIGTNTYHVAYLEEQ